MVRHILCSCFFVFAAISAQAAPSYFEAGVPVKGQGEQERSAAAQDGLIEVLARMSGEDESVIRSDATVQQRSATALSYVLQFRYADLDDSAALAQGYNALLYLDYSPQVVKEILQSANLPFWPVNRPATLVWLVEDGNSDKHLVNAASAPEFADALERQSQRLGVPLTFPLLDLQDQYALDADQVWNLDENAIRDASERYHADLILIGKYTQTSSGQYWVNWQLLHGDQSRVWDSRADNFSDTARLGLGPLAHYLAQKYASRLESSADSDSLYLLVHQVDSYGDYRGVLDLVQGLDAVQKVQVDKVLEDVLYLRVKVDVALTQFTNVLALGGHLQAMPAPDNGDTPVWQLPPAGSLDNPLRYRWVAR